MAINVEEHVDMQDAPGMLRGRISRNLGFQVPNGAILESHLALGVRLDYYRQGAHSNIAQISLRQMKNALSWKSFARSIQSCQRHILLGARGVWVVKCEKCQIQVKSLVRN